MKSWRSKIENFQFLPFDGDLDFRETKFQVFLVESRAFICVMNIVVKIKVVEETQLYRNFWISGSRDRPGGELWKVDGRKLNIFNFLPFDGDLDFHETKISKRETKISSFWCRISSFYMCNEYCGKNKSCRGDQTI